MSNTTGGGPPPDDKHPLEVLFGKVQNLPNQYGKRAVIRGVVVLVIFLFTGTMVHSFGWIIIMFASAFIIPAFLVARGILKRASKNKEDGVPLSPWRWSLIILLLALIVPIGIPAFWSYWNHLVATDWDRTFEQPTVYYVWKVDESIFLNEAAKTKVRMLNPKLDENSAIRESLKMAALRVGMPVDRVRPFEEAYLKKGQTYTVIFFESFTQPVWITRPVQLTEADEKDQKKATEPPEPPPVEKVEVLVPQLMVYFATAMDPAEAEELREEKSLVGNEQLVGKRVPESIEVTLPFLVNGLAESMGKHPNILIEPAPSAMPLENLLQGPTKG